MADGSLRLQIDIRPDDAQRAFKLFGTPNSAVALARLTDEVAVEEERPGKKKKGPFGESARALVQSGFFRTPNIWAGIGPDSEFLEWLKHQKSALSGKRDYYEDTFEGCCVPAHVRHLEHGGGTGIKPEYSAIPLTNEEHQLAHQKGDSALGEREWWDKMRIKYVSQWAYETLKEKMGYDSYTDIAPYAIRAWAKQRELENLLPKSFHVQSTESTPEGEA
ncbi:MAG: hypothetical protein GY815_05670 [Gammaproteobacteria bacterium]|nr:hypothetical protein [Gammaproteobacteria bacterium]